MSTERLVLGNWKMNTSRAEAISIAESLRVWMETDRVTVGISPPFPWIEPVKSVLDSTHVLLGAQTCAATKNGAFTGEVSAAMVAELCDFVLVGHSERRTLFGETDEIVREKLERALEAGLIPVLCVGETLDQRATGNADTTVTRQLNAALVDISPEQLRGLVVAYEPVWAIGTGHTASPQDASAMCSLINRTVTGHGPTEIPVLYGGSVSATNAASLMAAGSIDGFLVGGASLKPDDFKSIISSAAN